MRSFLYGLLAAALILPARPALAAPEPPPSGYERAVAAVPARHWLLVQQASIDRSSGGQARRSTRSIHLTPGGAAGQLHHEVGHIVAYSDPALEADWRRTFWPNGRPAGVLPSAYARTNDREDFAETYRLMIERGCVEDRERTAFMLARVFHQREVPPCRD